MWTGSQTAAVGREVLDEVGRAAVEPEALLDQARRVAAVEQRQRQPGHEEGRLAQPGDDLVTSTALPLLNSGRSGHQRMVVPVCPLAALPATDRPGAAA